MKKQEINIKIAEYLFAKRKKFKLSHRKLEKKCGVSKSMLSTLEGGSDFNFNPTIHTLNKILLSYDDSLVNLINYIYKNSTYKK